MVDNVDNFRKKCLTIPESLYLYYFSGIEKRIYCEENGEKNPQDIQHGNVNNLVDNVDKLTGKKIFSDIYYVSGAHSYQQIILFTFF